MARVSVALQLAQVDLLRGFNSSLCSIRTFAGTYWPVSGQSRSLVCSSTHSWATGSWTE
jgi:hypothetical protein